MNFVQQWQPDFEIYLDEYRKKLSLLISEIKINLKSFKNKVYYLLEYWKVEKFI